MLFVVIVAVSGFIAYLGDYIGRKVGKKKLSLFGLRPRKFAVLVSILSGILISLFTLGVLTAISPAARQALFQLEQIKREKRRAEARLREQEKKVFSFEEDLAQKKKELKKLLERLSAFSREHKMVAAQLEKEKKNLSQAQSILKKVEGEKKVISGALKKKRFQLKEAKAKIERITKRIGDLQSRMQELSEKKKELAERIESLREQGNEVFARLAKAQKELEAVKEEKRTLTTAFEKIRKGKVIIAAKEPLGYVIISAHTSREKAQKKLLENLAKLDVALQARGAGKNELGNRVIVYEKVFHEILNSVSKKPEASLVRILSANNVLENEPVRVEFEVAENKKLLPAGEVLSRGEIRGDAGREEVERTLIDLIQRAREKAIELGMLPEADFRSLPLKDFLKIIELILKTSEDLTVKVVNTEDLYVSGPLTIWLEIREKKS